MLICSVLIQALACSRTEREEQRRRGRERRAPDESTKLRVRCDFFCTNATSGIMRRRRLMCESRVLPCPKGSAAWQKGETREEGGHILDMFALSVKQKRHSIECLCFIVDLRHTICSDIFLAHLMLSSAFLLDDPTTAFFAKEV